MSDSVTPWTAAHQASLSFTVSWSLLKFMSIESVMLSNHLILCHPLLVLPSIFLSTRVFSNELALCIRWPKYWSFSFSISPFNEYPGLISSRGASLVAQLVKNPPAMQKTLLWFLSWEDPLEKRKATHSCILGLFLWLSWRRIHLQCWRARFNSWVGKIHWVRERLPTPVFWPREFHELYSPWGC